jgi:hypothetical protein
VIRRIRLGDRIPVQVQAPGRSADGALLVEERGQGTYGRLCPDRAETF